MIILCNIFDPREVMILKILYDNTVSLGQVLRKHCRHSSLAEKRIIISYEKWLVIILYNVGVGDGGLSSLSLPRDTSGGLGVKVREGKGT